MMPCTDLQDAFPPSIRPVNERRREVRVDVETDVDVRMKGVAFTGFSANVSENGMLIAWHSFMGRPPRLRERLAVTFTLPGAREPIAASAEVRWSLTGKARGVGLRFLHISAEHRRTLGSFVALRAPLAD